MYLKERLGDRVMENLMRKWMGWDVLEGKFGSLVCGMFSEKDEKVGM